MKSSNRKTKPIQKIENTSKPGKRRRLRASKKPDDEAKQERQNENIQSSPKAGHRIMELLTATEIPYQHLIFSGEKVSKEEKLRHIMGCYAGVRYINKLRKLTSEQRLRHNLVLPTANVGQKTLFLDLDETLIHASTDSRIRLQNSVSFWCDGSFQEVTFCIRPHCFEFLDEISKYYEIYIFTASYNEYARAIMNFLNKNKQTITGYLSRENCLQTSLGLYIKDLVRVANREAHQMLIVDNLVHSFGEQIDNGIPILQFNGNTEDQELSYLKSYLVTCSKYYDVREYNRQSLKLSEIVMKLEDFFQKETEDE